MRPPFSGGIAAGKAVRAVRSIKVAMPKAAAANASIWNCNQHQGQGEISAGGLQPSGQTQQAACHSCTAPCWQASIHNAHGELACMSPGMGTRENQLEMPARAWCGVQGTAQSAGA